MVSIDIESLHKEGQHQTRSMAGRSLVTVLAGGIWICDRLREPKNSEIAGTIVIAFGVNLIKKTSPVGAALVEIGVAALLTHSARSSLDS